jgi:peptidoglycan hydrolase-like protein with peptidoglycan-binding domain
VTWRPLHLHDQPYEKSADVRKAQVLLAKNGYMHLSDVDSQYGPMTAQAVHTAKFRMGYPLEKVDTTFGPALHGYLSGKLKPSLAMRARAKARKRGLGREAHLRAAIVRWAHWGVQHEPSIGYSQGPSRMNGVSEHAGHLPLDTDCSSFHTILHKWAGAGDPSGLGFNGTGFTGTIWDHCVPVAASQVKPGDGVIFGAYPGHHIATVVGKGDHGIVELVSHGQQAGPIQIDLATERGYQENAGHHGARFVTLPKW